MAQDADAPGALTALLWHRPTPSPACEATLARTPLPFSAPLRICLANLHVTQARDTVAARRELELALKSLKLRKRLVGGDTTQLVHRWQLCQAAICTAERQLGKAQDLYLKVLATATPPAPADAAAASGHAGAIAQLARRGLVDVALGLGAASDAHPHLEALQHASSAVELESDDWMQSALGWTAFLEALSASAGAKEEFLSAAEARLRRALEINDASSTHLCRLGQVLWEKAEEFRVDKTSGCFSYWLRAAKADRDNADAFACLGRYYGVSAFVCARACVCVRAMPENSLIEENHVCVAPCYNDALCQRHLRCE